MRVTSQGQVTIPQHIREKLGISPSTEVDFVEDNGRFYLTTRAAAPPRQNRTRRVRDVATVKMSTREILSLTKGNN